MSSYIYFLLALVPSVVLHEVSHGYVAYLFGDPTAKEAHRLTLNPLRHIDPFGSILLPVLLIFSGLPAFGYAKPVPVNFSRLRHPRRESLYVSLVGPLVNIVLSAVGFGISEVALHVVNSVVLLNVGVYFGLVNLILAVFNLIPIPPLDGSAIVERLVPGRHLGSYYRFRSMALPIVMIIVIADSLYFHVGTGVFNSLENWWLNRLF
ncbi:MAG TPA: site-2 protease family protein [Acidimicrobiales bacterium]|nr:site-2 protease family protein [Acidimicrobiales bacterium]